MLCNKYGSRLLYLTTDQPWIRTANKFINRYSIPDIENRGNSYIQEKCQCFMFMCYNLKRFVSNYRNDNDYIIHSGHHHHRCHRRHHRINKQQEHCCLKS